MEIVYCDDRAKLVAAYKAVRDGPRIAFDYETTGLDPHTDVPLLAQFAAEGGPVYVIPTRGNDRALTEILKLLPGKITLAHNASFEYRFTLQHYGVRLGQVFDTQLAEAILTAGLNEGTGLDDTAARRLSLSLDKTLQKSFIGADPATFEATPEQIAYAAEDVAILFDLRAVQLTALRAEGLLKVAALEFDALPVFAEMELAGMRLNADKHIAVLEQYEADTEHYGNQAASVLEPYWRRVRDRQREQAQDDYDIALAEINYATACRELPKLRERLLAKRAGTKPHAELATRIVELEKVVSYGEGAGPGDLVALRGIRDKAKAILKDDAALRLTQRERVLAALAEAGVMLKDLTEDTVEKNQHRSPVLLTYAKWSKAHKVASTYGAKMRERINPKTGRIHFGYRQMVSSGRTSSDGSQVMPPVIRACFEPEPGNVFVVADFAAMEWRIAAGLSQDPAMLEGLNNGQDPHKVTAAAAWPDRYRDWTEVPKEGDDRANAKIGNFASIYGATVPALVYQMGLTEADAKAILAGIEAAYPVMWKWVHDAGEQAVHTGYAVTALGRKRYFRTLPPCPRGFQAAREWKRQRSGIVRAAMNHPVQGTGADIAKRAMVMVYRQLRAAASWYGTVPGKIVGMVHDEIIVECPKEYAENAQILIAYAMKEAGAELISGVEISAEVKIVNRWEK